MIGNMDKRIGVLKYRNNQWAKEGSIWGLVEEKLQRRIYSNNGIAANTTVYVTTYKDNKVSFCDLLEFDGGKHIITASLPKDNKLFCDLVCSRVLVKTFEYETKSETLDEFNRVVRENESVVRFDGILAEKYAKTEDEKAHSAEEQRFVLIVPKPFALNLGTVLKADGVAYVAKARHENGEYMNEYEIVAEGDV